MNVHEAVLKRRSVRNFQDRDIPAEVVEKLKDALIWAPSAGNLQSRKFYFVTSGEVKLRLVEAALGQGFIARAPLVVVCCTDGRITSKYGERGLHLYCIQDVAASIMNMMLVAAEEGLGTVWVGAFEEKRVFEVLKMPGHLRPVAIVPVGYPLKIPSAPPRVAKDRAVITI